MSTAVEPIEIDEEARALAQCYALLIRKARERRERIAADNKSADLQLPETAEKRRESTG